MKENKQDIEEIKNILIGYLESDIFTQKEKVIIKENIDMHFRSEANLFSLFESTHKLYKNRVCREPLTEGEKVTNIIVYDFKEKKIIGYQ